MTDGRIEIFDGLQRLTTLTVLMAILRDASTASDHKKRLQDLITCAKGRRNSASAEQRNRTAAGGVSAHACLARSSWRLLSRSTVRC